MGAEGRCCNCHPNLAPELARGFELAYEHYLDKGGLLSANFFHRRISDLMRNVVALEDVSWSTDKRWVSRPQNVGNATAQGIELEAKFRLDEMWPTALPVSVRTNVSFFDSSVDQVPGPNNRLEGQPKGTANIGADYKFRGLPLSVGASVNYTPAYDLQLSDIQSTTMGAKVVTDAFLVWFINPKAQLRLSANNLAPRDYLNTSSILSGTQRQDNNRQALFVELDEEYSPRLAAGKWPQLLDAVDGNAVLVVQKKLVGMPVEEGVVDVFHIHRPIQLGVKITHQLRGVGNGAQFFDLRVLCGCSGGHQVFPLFSSTPSTRRAGAPHRLAPGPA